MHLRILVLIVVEQVLRFQIAMHYERERWYQNQFCFTGSKASIQPKKAPTYVLLVHVIDRLQYLFDKCTCIFFRVAAFLYDSVE